MRDVVRGALSVPVCTKSSFHCLGHIINDGGGGGANNKGVTGS
jgi:hypothetical protein